jgi:GNAT superfamily N-acetyltransferase
MAAVAGLFDRYRQFYQQASDITAVRRFISERIQNEDSKIYLAWHEGRVVGFVQLYPSFSSVAMKRLWILNDLFVAVEARKKGVAKALLDRSVKLARETGARGLSLKTAVDNHSAQKLYLGQGWKKDEKFFSYGFTLG